MGNSSPEQPITYTIVKKQCHPILGPLTIVSVPFGQTPQLCLLKHRSNLDIATANKSIRWLMTKENNHACKYVLKKIYAQASQDTSYCSSWSQQQIFFEKFQQDLQLQFYSKKSNSQRFSQPQVLKIIHDCTLALRLTSELNMKFYHPSKHSILKHKNGNYMLILAEDVEIDHPLQMYRSDFKEEMLGKNYYLSPQLLLGLQTEEEGAVTTKDQIFALGATLLSLCLMKDLPFQSQIIGVCGDDHQKEYRFEEKKIKRQVEKLRLLTTGIEYSEKIKNLIKGMLTYDRTTRISVEQIIGEVGEYEKNVKIQRVGHERNLSSSKGSNDHNKTLSTNKSSHQRALSTTQSKKMIEVYLDAKHLFEEAKEVKSKIAMDPKTYKNSKMGKFKLDSHPHKEVVSQFTSKQSQFTPIKQLEISPFSPKHHVNLFSDVISLPRTESRYEFVSENTIPAVSKTSIALNMISQFSMQGVQKMRFKLRQ